MNPTQLQKESDMPNPNLFKLQVDPDGLYGHIEREQIRKELDDLDRKEIELINVTSELQLPGKFFKGTSKREQKELKQEKKEERRRAEIERLRKNCEFFGVGCNKSDCIKCRSKGIPLHKIKNLIEWIHT